MTNELAKRLEDEREARRTRARTAVATGEFTLPPPVEKPKPKKVEPKPWGRRRYTENKVQRHVRACEHAIEEAEYDFPDLAGIDLAHDVAWNYIGGIKNWEHPKVVREVRRRFDVWAD